MRRINEDRKRRTLPVLSNRLEELPVARRKAAVRLEDLDRQRTEASLERSALYSLHAPIESLSNDILAMIFESGITPTTMKSMKGRRFRFGSLVSQVNQRWRNVALGTPRLWTDIWCVQPPLATRRFFPRSEKWKDSAPVFLSRSGRMPVDIFIVEFSDGEFSPELLQLIDNHMWRCRLLSMTGETRGLTKLLKHILAKTNPILSSIYVKSIGSEHMKFREEFFTSSIPTLNIADLSHFYTNGLGFGLPALTFVTTLRIDCITWNLPKTYLILRDFLMALHSLTHLELQIIKFSRTESLLPIDLPTTQFLKLDDNIGEALGCIRATSLVALSLVKIWDGSEAESALTAVIDNQFPALKHLIYSNASLKELDLLAQKFPNIDSLTCQWLKTKTSYCNIHTVLSTMCPWSNVDSHVDGGSDPTSHQPHWPRLNTIAVLSLFGPLHAVALYDTIRTLQDGGHPIRKLLLPPKQLQAQENANALLGLRGLVEIADFIIDWPTPFVSD